MSFRRIFQAGSVHVRVRRDADEQMVLAHVYHRLSNLVSVLTVQIFKDDWSRPNTVQILGDTSLFNKGLAPGSTASKGSFDSTGSQVSSHYTSLSSTSFTSTQHGALTSSSSLTSQFPRQPQFLPLSSSLSSTAVTPSSSVGGGGASINMGKLNPDILNLLGSTAGGVSTGVSSKSASTLYNSQMDFTPRQQHHNSNSTSGIYSNTVTTTPQLNSLPQHTVTRTEPDGASKTASNHLQ